MSVSHCLSQKVSKFSRSESRLIKSKINNFLFYGFYSLHLQLKNCFKNYTSFSKTYVDFRNSYLSRN